MIKRIRPVTRVARIEGEIQRLMNDVLSERRELPELQGGWSANTVNFGGRCRCRAP